MSSRLKCYFLNFILRFSEFQNLIFFKRKALVKWFHNHVCFLFLNFLLCIFPFFYFYIFNIFNLDVGDIPFHALADLLHKNFKTANQFIVSDPILLEIKIGLECFSSFQNEFILILFCSWYHLMEKVVVLGAFIFGYRYLKLACSETVDLMEILGIKIK